MAYLIWLCLAYHPVAILHQPYLENIHLQYNIFSGIKDTYLRHSYSFDY